MGWVVTQAGAVQPYYQPPSSIHKFSTDTNQIAVEYLLTSGVMRLWK